MRLQLFLSDIHKLPTSPKHNASGDETLMTMGKRQSDSVVGDGNQAYLKRQKISHVTSSAEDIRSARQLQQLSAFDQDVGRAKHGRFPTCLIMDIC